MYLDNQFLRVNAGAIERSGAITMLLNLVLDNNWP